MDVVDVFCRSGLIAYQCTIDGRCCSSASYLRDDGEARSGEKREVLF